MQLQEQAEELGFETVQEALDNGYEVIQRTMGAPRDLDEIDREPEVWYELQKKDELEEAHEAWLKEKEEVLEELDVLNTYFKEIIDASAVEHNLEETFIFAQLKGYVKDAIGFIKKGEV